MQYRASVTLFLRAQLGAQLLAQKHTMAFRVGRVAEWADMPKARLLVQC